MADDVIAIPRAEVDMTSLFRGNVPSEMAEEIVTIIRDAYRAAPELARSLYEQDQAREVAPRLRRAQLESRLLSLTRFADVKCESLKSSGSSYFVQLEVGELVLIAARAIDPDKMIPKAAYRTRIALQSAQRSLFGDEPIDSEARYYAIILHGSARGQVDPTFIRVRFPTSDHETYLDDGIDLKKEYAYLFDPEIDVATPPVEQIADTQHLAIRREPATASDDDKA